MEGNLCYTLKKHSIPNDRMLPVKLSYFDQLRYLFTDNRSHAPRKKAVTQSSSTLRSVSSKGNLIKFPPFVILKSVVSCTVFNYR